MQRTHQAGDLWRADLNTGCEAMGLALSDQQRGLLLSYLDLLSRWNRVFNLTAVRDPGQMVGRQLLDSLSVLPWLDEGPVLDVGTGAGLPGLPLAIARPELEFTLLDANGKKTRFVQQAVGELGLDNVNVVRDRVEVVQQPRHYRCILSRAFATLADTVGGSASLLHPAGCWLAMKGAAPHAEIRDLPPGLRTEIAPLRVPGETAPRHLVIIRPI